VGILRSIEKRLVKRLSKGFHKHPWFVVFLLVFMPMLKRNTKKKMSARGMKTTGARLTVYD